MPNHAGQISFPGGKVEKNERARTAALRETQEEIGIEASKISLMGRLPSFDAAYAFRVTPFVGIVDSAADIRPDPREVAEVFEVPFEFFMNSDNHKPHPVNYGDKDFTMYDMPYTDAGGTYRYIWGMTAMIIYNLYQRGFEHGA
jgi:8-oxo-dGTP pyrophosphatase MutT (NUDIX family)